MKLDEISQSSATVKSDPIEKLRSMRNIKKIIDQTICGEFVWKIDKWSAVVRMGENGINQEMFSNSFLSHQNGYKISISVMTEGHYLNIGFSILHSINDRELHWPFDRDVELSLMDQNTGRSHKIWKFECSNYPLHVSLQKPKKDSKKMSFYDYYPFISRKEMSNGTKLCQNDQIFVKFSRKTFERQK